jgi:hypothetical protein
MRMACATLKNVSQTKKTLTVKERVKKQLFYGVLRYLMVGRMVVA